MAHLPRVLRTRFVQLGFVRVGDNKLRHIEWLVAQVYHSSDPAVHAAAATHEVLGTALEKFSAGLIFFLLGDSSAPWQHHNSLRPLFNLGWVGELNLDVSAMTDDDVALTLMLETLDRDWTQVVHLHNNFLKGRLNMIVLLMKTRYLANADDVARRILAAAEPANRARYVQALCELAQSEISFFCPDEFRRILDVLVAVEKQDTSLPEQVRRQIAAVTKAPHERPGGDKQGAAASPE